MRDWTSVARLAVCGRRKKLGHDAIDRPNGHRYGGTSHKYIECLELAVVAVSTEEPLAIGNAKEVQWEANVQAFTAIGLSHEYGESKI